jgi:hypothetical protein
VQAVDFAAGQILANDRTERDCEIPHPARNHPYTLFRVRVDGLQPRTTYYYTVDSMEGNGTRDGVKSPVRHFTTR